MRHPGVGTACYQSDLSAIVRATGAPPLLLVAWWVGCRLRLVQVCSAGCCFVVLLACVGGLALLTCVCAFDGFLL